MFILEFLKGEGHENGLPPQKPGLVPDDPVSREAPSLEAHTSDQPSCAWMWQRCVINYGSGFGDELSVQVESGYE